MIDIANLNLRMCEFALARLHARGESDSGLYNYYSHLAQKGTMLRPEEIAVAEYVDRAVPKHKSILELCAGAAQLGHLLSLLGYPASAVEIDQRRYELAVDLGAHVGSKCTVSLGGWQSLKLGNWQLLVTLNAATNHISPTDVEWLGEHARRGGEFIIRPRQFGAAGVAVEIPELQTTKVTDDVYHYRAA
jgi:hypothetical protein